MKKLVFSLLTTFITTSSLWAQVMESPLNNDASFRKALSVVQYPLLAEPPTEPARIYVDFTIDQGGKIGDVKLMKIGSFSSAFVGEVTRLFAGLSTQKFTHGGTYVLPVTFESKPRAGVYQLTASDRAAFNSTFVQLAHSRTLLTELYVTAN